jgi:hypothetical protein
MPHFIKLLILTCTVGIIFSSCSDDVKYYRQLTADGKFFYKGSYPVSETEVDGLNCYRIVSRKDQIQSVEFLKAGKLQMSALGFARKTFTEEGGTILIATADQFGLPLAKEDGYYFERLSKDKNGKFNRLEFLDRNRHPMANQGIGYVVIESDERNRRAKSWYRVGADQPVRNQEGVFGIQRAFNDQDLIVEWVYLDLNKRPMEDKNGIAYVHIDHDEAGNETSVSKFDLHYKLISSTGQASTIKSKYDESGNKTETTYHDSFGKIITSPEGLTITIFKHDNAGNLINQSFYDSMRKPVNYNGHFQYGWAWDKMGRCKKAFYIKNSDKNSEELDFYVKYMYNESGDLVEERRYNPQHVLLEENGVAIKKYTYDGAHSMTAFMTLNSKEELTPFESNVAQIRWSYNDRGDRIESRYWDEKGNLTGGEQHVAINKFAYNTCGFLIEQNVYDSLKQPVEFDGVSTIRYSYDSKENFVGTTRLNKNGEQISEN